MAELDNATSRFDRSIVNGPIRTAVWRLAWPAVLQNVVAGLQGIIDHAMVGHFVGYSANAAIGVSGQILLVFIPFISSLYIGMGVLVARFVGADEREKVDRVVYQAILTTFALAAVLAAFGYVGSPALLELVNAAPEVRGEALAFLRVMFVGMIGIMLFFMVSGAFRAAGDARTPLRLGLSMTLLTIIFNVILIPPFGTIGAAAGTVASSTLISCYGLWCLARPGSVFSLRRGGFRRPDLTIIRSLFRFGLPASGQGIAINIGGVLLLRFIGSLELSAEAQAAYSIVYIELFSIVAFISVGAMGAAATFAGQNLGVGNSERAVAGIRSASRLGLGLVLPFSFVFLALPRHLLSVFGMNDPAVVGLGVQLLRYLAVSAPFVAVAMTYTGGLQGTGDTRSPFYISIVTQVIVPISLCLMFQGLGVLEPHEIWLALVLGHVLRCLLSVGRFRQQKWKSIQVDLKPLG